MKQRHSQTHTRSRGQLYSSDALLSIVIFLFAATLISAVNQQLQNQAAEEHNAYTLSLTTARTAAILFTSPGNPTYWDTNSNRSDVLSVGVSPNGTAISPAKWAAFLDWNATNYTQLVSRMGLEDLNFYVTISDENKTILTRAGTAPINKNTVSVVTLPVVYQSRPAIATVQVYGV